jgi:hypothetical protein
MDAGGSSLTAARLSSEGGAYDLGDVCRRFEKKPLVTGKSPFEGLSSAPGALKSTFSRHNSLVLKVLTDTFRGAWRHKRRS